MSLLKEQKCVMIIAGEASGDLHGSKLVMAMRKSNDSLFFCGIGGQALKNAGVRILVDASELAVVGITEAFPKIISLVKGMTIAKRLLKTLHPDLLILIDFPDFNLHIAASAKKLGIPILYYISPQVWALRSGRIKKIGNLVDHVAVILPFEEDLYLDHKIPVTFVGHPLLDIDHPRADEILKRSAENRSIIGLLPGSRDREIARHLSVMLDAAQDLVKRSNDLKFIISIASSVKRKYVEAIVEGYRDTVNFELLSDNVDKVLEKCGFVIAASGTVTLEAAIYGVPMVIIYKMSPISYWLGRALAKVKNIGLVNLIEGKEIVPELLQGKASPENIANTVYDMLNDSSGLTRLKKDLLDIRDLLGGQGASERVARIAMDMI
ncbi:MAG: lipid-A-disaccharide synthase [Desulfobacterales bacterium]